MADIWFISDTHFCHSNILNFMDNGGRQIRGQRWQAVEDMDDYMVQQWNSVVKPQDKVYHLGDFACGVKSQGYLTGLMHRLHGHKRLILGNHDRITMDAYKGFDTIELWTGGKFKYANFVASHIPLRHDQMRDGAFNVHGHIHQNVIDDPRYINVCVEQINYTPVHLDWIKAQM